MSEPWWEDAERFREARRAMLAGEDDRPEPSDVLDADDLAELYGGAR